MSILETKPSQVGSLSSVMPVVFRCYYSGVCLIRSHVGAAGFPKWQRNYIRNTKKSKLDILFNLVARRAVGQSGVESLGRRDGPALARRGNFHTHTHRHRSD